MVKPKVAIMVGLILSLIGLGVTPSSQKITAQERVMTEKQKEHGKLYGQYHKLTGDRKLRDITTRKGDADIKEDVNMVLTPPTPVLSLSGSSIPSLETLACDADAVVIGTVKSKSSQLTEDGYFVFTDYELNVEEVLKDNPTAHIQPNSDITITRPGGQVYIDNRNISAIDKSFLPLEERGRYVLFLRFIPQTGAYKAVSSESSFQLRGERVVCLTEELSLHKSEIWGDVPSFLIKVGTSISNGCGDVNNNRDSYCFHVI